MGEFVEHMLEPNGKLRSGVIFFGWREPSPSRVVKPAENESFSS